MHTYKVSRKLQNIYYYQEGIIMLRSKDKTIMQKHGNIAEPLFSPLLQHFLPSGIRKDITHLYQEKKLRYHFCTKHLFTKKNKFAHKTQNVCMITMWAVWKVTLKPPSEKMVIKQKGTSTYSSTELQITRAKLLICL